MKMSVSNTLTRVRLSATASVEAGIGLSFFSQIDSYSPTFAHAHGPG